MTQAADSQVKALGTTIHIYLANGDADGVWIVEKSNWTGKALMATRRRFRELRARSDLEGSGVYVLVGPSDSDVWTTRIYVGETENLPSRLDSHNRDEDFWNRVIVFTSKDDNLNKADIRYLEARLIELAKRAERAELANSQKKLTHRPLSERDRAEAEGFLTEMLLIYPVLGVRVFVRADEEPSGVDRLRLVGKDTKAEGRETADGFLVFSGSLARATEVPSIHAAGTHLRQVLLEKGIMVAKDNHLQLTRDFVFASPSTAAMVMLGRTANGRTEWKNSDGRTLKDVQTAELD